MKRSWRTTLAGLITAAGIIVRNFWPQHAGAFDVIIAAAIAGGFLSARDNVVTSEDVRRRVIIRGTRRPPL